jgi:hypothetical protein
MKERKKTFFFSIFFCPLSSLLAAFVNPLLHISPFSARHRYDGKETLAMTTHTHTQAQQSPHILLRDRNNYLPDVDANYLLIS